jgi:enediyne biosynthesis protein E5
MATGGTVTSAWRSFSADARHFQIVALGTLLCLSNFWSDFGSGWMSFICATAGAMVAQFAGDRATGRKFDFRSPLITACSLAILLRGPDPVWHAAAGAFAIASKYIFKINGKHLFNPANVAITAFLVGFDAFWISPGQWGATAWFIGVFITLGALTLTKAARWDTALWFSATFAACLFGRAVYLGDPMTIPLHQMQSGALIVFTGFMITDPRSTPNHWAGRMLFAISVAVLGWWLQWRWQLRPGLIYALVLCCPLTPLLDYLFKATRFTWRGTKDETRADARPAGTGRDLQRA